MTFVKNRGTENALSKDVANFGLTIRTFSVPQFNASVSNSNPITDNIREAF